MDVDRQLAAELGFPKTKYMAVERERRWLCRQLPRLPVRGADMITDLYVTGTCLRLREARPTDGGAPILRFTRKADADRYTRLLTSIYLPEHEFALLAASLPGKRIKKLRHRFHDAQGVVLVVDEFLEQLAGLFIAEAEFETQGELEAYAGPDFAVCEITDRPEFGGAQLAIHGMPEDLPRLL
ncbi:MAG TPA: hypothetical protein VF472_11345 [Burkholderiaceae bacterium]